jgi:type I restriction enzyme S subunit
MYYLLQSREFTLWFDLSNAGNSTICHLNQEKFYNFKFAYPSLPEQKKIADYLDEKCSEIEATIADKQKQLETLEEYKKSLIFEYVTGKKEVV